MALDRWRRVEQLYRAALERTPPDRRSFLVEACEGDKDLIREIESLLAQEAATQADASIWEATNAGPLHAGAQLGPYQIEAPIGAGGMGEVFRALDTRLRRTVAIKLLPRASVADAARRRRFLQEARTASALNHPNIVAIYDISSQGGADFLVMEYVHGQNLKDLIKEKELLLEQVVHIGLQVASALEAAHAAGIVHRDIKPANIMVTPSQVVKVLDFGIAKMTPLTAATDETQTLDQATAAGVLVGTPAYMSPEQARGELVDGRSDIFSLGCVLYEAATRQRPFGGANPIAILQEIAAAAPVAPTRIRPGLPRAFDDLIAACLEKRATQRLASATKLAEALVSLSRPESTPAPKTDTRRAVAVVPFRFRTAASEDQFLSVALADAVANRLGSASKLVVRPTASVAKYAGKDTEWMQVARELNVEVVVEGSIQKMGPRVRVLVQAYDAGDGRTLHSAKYDGEMGDLFSLQDRIADSVFEVFSPRTIREQEPQTPPAARHPMAFELYMRAVDCAARLGKFEFASAIEMLERAVDLDPGFADAWGLLASACTQMGMYLDPDPKWLERAEQAIARTLELDPLHCDAFCARGMILWTPSHGFQQRPALRALNASIRINPSRYLSHGYRGIILSHLSTLAEAEKSLEEAIRVNPGYAMLHLSRSYVALYRGDYGKAEEYRDHALAIDPAQPQGNANWAEPPIWAGQLERAREKVRRARQMVPDEPQITAQEGLILAREGDFKRAEQLADEVAASKKSLVHMHHSWHNAAGVYAMCGKPEKAMAQLKRSAEFGLPSHVAFGNDPHLRSLREYPEFVALQSQLRRDYDALKEEFGLAG